MVDSRTPLAPSTPANQTASTLWTVFLGTALLGLVALPKHRGGPPVARTVRTKAGKLGPEGGSVSHEGAAAEQLAEREPERGRKAVTPSEIPAKGWKDIALRLYQEFGNDRILLVAAGVTFYTILALFPAVAALVSIYGAVADPSTINTHLNDLRGILPDGAIDIIGGQVKRLTEKGDRTLGLTALVSILISLWSANGGVKAIFDALNIAYEEEEKRSFIRLNLQSLAFTAGALLFVVVALTGIVVVPAVLQVLGLSAAVTKGGHDRVVFLNARLRKEVGQYRATLVQPPALLQPVLVTQKRSAFSANTLCQLMGGWYVLAGLDGGSSHSGRRWFITRLAHAGISPKAIMMLAGHRHLSTTQRYIDVNDEMMRAAVEVI